MRDCDDIRLVDLGIDPQTIGRKVSVYAIDAVCVRPMAPDKFLRFRHLIERSKSHVGAVRLALLVDSADAGFVYYVLGYGVDDVVVLSPDDDELRASLRCFARGDEKSCARFLVPTVDVPFAVSRGTLDLADEVDRQIVRLISVGYTDREISDILHFSHQVIRNRISHIMLRSNLRNRTQLAARYTAEAIKRGLETQP